MVAEVWLWPGLLTTCCTSGKSLLSKETPGITQESLGTPRMLRTARTHREPQDKINNFRITQDILRITQDSLRIYSG